MPRLETLVAQQLEAGKPRDQGPRPRHSGRLDFESWLCKNLGKEIDFSESQFSHLQNGAKHTHYEVIIKVHYLKISCVRHVVVCLAPYMRKHPERWLL